MPDRLFHHTTRDFAVECVADLDAGRPVIVAVGMWEDGEWQVDEYE